MSPLVHLHSVAHEHHARLVSSTGEYAIYNVCPPNPSGSPSSEFILEIRRVGNTVTVKEQNASILPAFCAERHINPGGTFCLYWDEVDPLEVNSRENAATWWGKLLIFLLRQNTASALRNWPGKADARAHGSAAKFQALAEENAATLGTQFLTALRDNRLRLARGRRHGRLRLLKDNQRLITVLREDRRVMTLRQRCKCDNADMLRLPLSACSTHAQQVFDLILNLEKWQEAEEIFYQSLRRSKHVCCGTMDDCPLAKQDTK